MPDQQALQQYAFVLPIVATIVGWFYVSSRADKREFRKEVREHVKELRGRAVTTKEAAKAYWLTAKASEAPACAVTLKAEIESLSRHVQIIRKVGLPVDDQLMVSIRQYATGGKFEQKGRRKVAEDRERMLDICGALEDLVSAVDESFYDRFKPTKERKWWHLGALLPLSAAGSDSAN